jgi:hypothetical protein
MFWLIVLLIPADLAAAIHETHHTKNTPKDEK